MGRWFHRVGKCLVLGIDATHGHGVCAGRDEDRRVVSSLTDKPSAASTSRGWARPSVVLLAVLGAGLLWADWPTLAAMVRKWSTDARYSHGFLVPVFSCYLLYQRRAMLSKPAEGGSWWGLALLGAGLVLKLVGVYFFVDWVGAVALLPVLAGVELLIGGWRGLRWSWPAFVFLVFMIPLPYRVETALGWPLQRLATEASTYLLQTLGMPALAEGNVIDVDGRKLGVVEACNGLGMLFTFFAFTAGAVILVHRPLLERLVILMSAIPAALVANVARITLTGVMHVLVGSRWADVVFHDLAGWLMMPLAVGMLWVEIEVLSSLYTIEKRGAGPPVGFLPG